MGVVGVKASPLIPGEYLVVYLNRIYTKTGDGGETSLGDGTRVPKTNVRIIAYGGVDELNSVLGVAMAHGLPDELTLAITRIQNDLFDVGADLCIPETEEPPAWTPLRITTEQVARLEGWIDQWNDRLEPLNSFILPGGALAAAHLHLARTICRRVEIGVIALAAIEKVNPRVIEYLNRLSDLLFVIARIANDDGRADVKWIPGANR